MTVSKSFKVGGGGAFVMFVAIAVMGVLGAVFFAMAHDWLMTAMTSLGALFAGAVCFSIPGVLTIDEAGLSLVRRRGVAALHWSDITKVVWDETTNGLAGAAADAWAVTITGTHSGVATTIVLSGPMVEKQAEVRALLEARYPRQG